MTYLEKYIGHKATQEDIDYFWKHTQEIYDGFCPSDITDGNCHCDDCVECWNREIITEE